MLPNQVRKRDGSIVAFDKEKIADAVKKAALASLRKKEEASAVSKSVTEIVLRKISGQYQNRVPAIESIQDIVEATLMSEGYSHIAKSYILYRNERSQLRAVKSILGLKDDLKLPINTIAVLQKRYLLKDDSQNIIETASELFRRAAFHVGAAEKRFKSQASAAQAEEKFYQMMRNLEFMPNSPTLMNAGTSLGQLSACFFVAEENRLYVAAPRRAGEPAQILVYAIQ